MADGFEQDQFIDAETWLLTAERKAAPIHAFGAAVKTETRFEDYRRVAGVLFAHSDREVELATGKVLNEMIWTSITANQPLEASAFSPPPFQRSSLQQLLEQLYAERADIAAVRWSYREFRRAHPEIDSDAGIEAIGYQMLKMGDAASAIAVLEPNAVEYPRSAGAAFGLGRAYRSAGRVEEARTELQRALALDPDNKRARDALRALGN
jgi:tetratricopeptide (TPR) repeat protein